MDSLINIFSGKKEDIPTSEPSVNTEGKTIATSSEVEGDKPFSQPEPPAMRRVIRVPSVSDDLFPPNDPDKVLIKAQPTTVGDQCLFMLNRPLSLDIHGGSLVLKALKVLHWANVCLV